MKGIKINVSNNIAQITEKPQRIIAGTVGLPVEYTFDSHWDGLVKYAVFAAGKKLMMFEIENTAVIPWEVLRKPGQQLMIGVYGEHPDGTEALPTVWANAGVIRHGAVPGTAPGIPSPPPVWESIKNSIGELDELNTEHKETLVGAINEVEEAIRTEVPLIANRVSTPSGYGFDKTYAEIKEAVAAGRTILLNNYDVLYAMSDSGPNYYKFLPFVTANTDVSKPGLRVNSSDVWSEVATGAEPMTEEKVKALIEENAPEGITEETVLDLIKNNASGGGLLVTVTATQTDPGSYSYSMDSDYATIKAEVDEGKEVIIRCQRTHDKQTGYQYYMYHRLIDPGMLGFMSLSTQDGTYELMGINVLNNVHITTYDMPVLKTTAQELTDSQKEQVKTNLGISGGGVSSWNDLTDKPTTIISHGDTLTWGGVATGVCVSLEGAGITFVKVHHAVPTSADFSNGVTVGISVHGDGVVETVTLSPEELAANTLPDGFVVAELVFIVPTDNYTVDESIFGAAITFPEAGIYFASLEAQQMYFSSITIPGYEFTTEKFKGEVLPGAGLVHLNSTDGVNYIYPYGADTSNPENRMTCAEFEALILSGCKIYVAGPMPLGDGTPTISYFPMENAYIAAPTGQPRYGSGYFIASNAYTAEYVPPTT